MAKRFELDGGGWLSVDEDGGLVRLEVRREDDGCGLYKVWLKGTGGGRRLLGTLSPEAGGLRLCRRVTRESLMRDGCWPLAGGECILAFSFGSGWRRQSCPKLNDPIAGRLEGRQVLMCREGEALHIALPFDTGRPFPLPGLFCLGRVERIEGATHVVYTFDRQGRPQTVG